MRKKYLILFGIVASLALLLSSLASPVSALTTFEWNGHGVVAKWTVNVKQGANTIQVPLTVVVSHDPAFSSNWIYVQAGSSQVKQDLPTCNYNYIGGVWYWLRLYVNIDLGNGLQKHLLDITWNWYSFTDANRAFVNVGNGIWVQITGTNGYGFATLMIDGGSVATPGNFITFAVLGFDGDISLTLM